jgi:arylsulfatase A-like enzyme
MTITNTMRLGIDNKLVAPSSMTPEQRKQWDAYYGPRNAAFTNAHLAGKDLVRWKYQRYLHDYLGTIKAVDEGVGRLLDYLDQTGLATNTIVVYSSDQGFFLGEHGWFDKRWVFEESVRTPLLVRWPGVTPKGAQNRDLVSVVDFAETFLEAAGLPVPPDMQGRSLVPLLRGQMPADWRKSFYYHYYEDGGEHQVAKHYGVITDRYKLVHFYDLQPPYWELYDLQKDPREMRSVFGQPDYAAAQKELEQDLARLRQQLQVPDKDAPISDPKYKPAAAPKAGAK